MTRKTQMFAAMLATVLFCGLTLAQEPELDINKGLHPNLYEAQRLVVQASHYVAEAEKENKYGLGGHAGKARQLLAQVNKELKAAATAANASNATSKKSKR